jgi:hypothetical protein
MLIVAALASATAAPAVEANWQVLGTTHNSVAFLDRRSMTGPGSQVVRVIRVSGQPQKDRWRSSDQHIRVDCAAGVMGDEGSTIEGADGKKVSYGPTPARQPKPSRGIFLQLFNAVCDGKDGPLVSDPHSWTAANFKVGM